MHQGVGQADPVPVAFAELADNTAGNISQAALFHSAVPIWTNSELGARFTTPILKDGLLFGYHGHFFCADAKTGATLWTDSTNRGNSAALVDAGQAIIATTVNSELVAFKPSEKEYTELARIRVADTEIWAHPVIDGNRIYVRDRENVALWVIE